MKMYATEFTVTGKKDGKLLNAKTSVVPINMGADQIDVGDVVIGEMFLDQFPDQQDKTKMIIMFKMMIVKVRKNKVKPTESF